MRDFHAERDRGGLLAREANPSQAFQTMLYPGRTALDGRSEQGAAGCAHPRCLVASYTRYEIRGNATAAQATGAKEGHARTDANSSGTHPGMEAVLRAVTPEWLLLMMPPLVSATSTTRSPAVATTSLQPGFGKTFKLGAAVPGRAAGADKRKALPRQPRTEGEPFPMLAVGMNFHFPRIRRPQQM